MDKYDKLVEWLDKYDTDILGWMVFPICMLVLKIRNKYIRGSLWLPATLCCIPIMVIMFLPFVLFATFAGIVTIIMITPPH